MARILVAGGAGYIGSHVCKQLSLLQHEVLTLDDLSTGHAEFVRFGNLVKVSLIDFTATEKAVRDFQPDGVFHFANSSYVGESMRDPEKYYHNNVTGTLNLLRAMRAYKSQTPLIFSSSCAVYGEPQGPLNESHPLQPVNPYGHSKLVCEDIIAQYHRAYGLPYICLRYFNAAGADADGEIGEWHEPETHLIPRLLQHAQGRSSSQDPVQILGDDYDTPDGTCIRDYVHVEDLGRAHVQGLQYLQDGGESFSVNLGTGHGYSVREVITTVEKITGKELKIPVGPRRPGDPARLVATGGLAEERLGWRPEYDLTAAVRSAWNWEQKRKEGASG